MKDARAKRLEALLLEARDLLNPIYDEEQVPDWLLDLETDMEDEVPTIVQQLKRPHQNEIGGQLFYFLVSKLHYQLESLYPDEEINSDVSA